MSDTGPFALRHLARIIDSSDDAIISKDLNGTIQSWNRAAERIFGFTAEEAIGRSIRMIIPADRQVEEDEVLARIRQGEGLSHFETIRQRKDGTLVPITLTISPLRDEHGTIVGASKIARDLSDRAMAELAARRLAAVVDSSDDAIVTKTLDSTITSWNRAAERMFGYTAEEAIGRSIRMIIPADRQHEEDLVLEKIRNGESMGHFETVRQHKNGALVPISLTVSPIRNQYGVVVGASKIARDITDRKLADLASRRLAAVVEWSDDAIITKDLASTITSWNRAAERMFGYTAAEAIGRSIRMLIPEDLQDEEDTVLARIRAGQTIDHFDTTRVRKDGSEVTISLTVSPIRDDSGKVIGASKIARDITEQSRLRAAAREQALITEKLGEVGATVAASLDRATIAQQVTDQATALIRAEFGAFSYEVIDAPTGEPQTQHAFAGASTGALRTLRQPGAAAGFAPAWFGPGVLRVDDVMLDSPGVPNPPDFAIPPGHAPLRSYLTVPVKSAAGEVIGGMFFGHSKAGMFTEQHERLVSGIAAWGSLALENARLYITAREADRLKDEFLAVLSHELRTPLNAIMGYARLLRGGVLGGDKAARGLETLERNAASLTQIVEDVLDISRIVSGKIRLDVQPVELPLVVHNAVATVQPAADAKQVRLQTVVDPRVGPVSGDPDRLQQVVWNLLSNAVKFTAKGGRVQIRLERVNSHVEIVVSDTGLGIRPEFLPYVFERFRQADAGMTRKTGGLGLGLSIARNIVEMHGGTVHASSEGEGHGATFRVRLPLMIVHSERVPEVREHPRTERLKPLTGLADITGIRVLAIDDEADALELLRVVLETAGARVTTLPSAAAALAEIETINPDVIVVDLGMPEIDGFQFIRQLRSLPNPAVRDIPAAALTAFARSEDRTRALQSGFEMHLAKPVDPGELVASVATLMRRSRRPT
jgi:PAS domain S-box-containing protein